MRHTTVLVVLVVCAILVAIPAGAQYYRQVQSATTVGVTPRALGMGDAYIAVTDDEQSLYWNPAGLAGSEGARWTLLGGAGRVANIDVIEDLASAYEIISEDEDDFISQADFDFLVDIARRSAGTPLKAEVGFLSAFSWDNLAIGTYGQAAGTAEFQIPGVGSEASPGPPPLPPGTGRVNVDSRAAGQTSAAVGGGWDFGDGFSAGITLRQVKYAESHINKTFRPESNVTVHVDETDDDDATTADLGVMYRPEPRVTFGAVVRNVTSPDFTLQLGGALGVVTREIDPSVHVGIGVDSEDGDTTAAFDIHNVTGANDTDATMHVGVEHVLDRHFTARAGYADDVFTWGLTGNFGSLALEMASSDNWDDMFGASFTVDF